MNNFSTGDSTSSSQGKGMGGLGSILQNPAQVATGGKGQNQGQEPFSVIPQQNINPPTQLDGGSGNVTYPGQGGQPKMGQPNAYSNTINPSDNTGMDRSQQMGSGKSGGSAKGAQ